MLAEVYSSALPCRSDALLHLEHEESFTSHKKYKIFLDLPAIYNKNNFCGVCVCVCMYVRVCPTLRACGSAYSAFPPTPPKSQGLRFRLAFSTGVQNGSCLIFWDPDIKPPVENKDV